jgi:hypothetical protein
VPDGAPDADVTSSTPTDPSADDDHHHEVARTERLVLDELSERLDTLKLLRADDDARADAILEQFGAKGQVESDMLGQISVRNPLAHPDRFEEAHRTVMRALEVFDRNAARPPSNLQAGPLEPVAAFVVQMLIRVIVRDYQKSVIENVRQLYARREANSVPASAEIIMLRRARMQADRLAPGLQKKSLGVPTYLLGGAAVSGVVSGLQGLLLSAAHSDLRLGIVAGVFSVLALAAFWCVLKAAAIARRRTRIALDQPLQALWETIGAAGHPPRDQSRQFATYAVVFLGLAWLVPIAIAIYYGVKPR